MGSLFFTRTASSKKPYERCVGVDSSQIALSAQFPQEKVFISDDEVAQLSEVIATPFDQQRTSQIIPGKDTGHRWVVPEIFLGCPSSLSWTLFSFALLDYVWK